MEYIALDALVDVVRRFSILLHRTANPTEVFV